MAHDLSLLDNIDVIDLNLFDAHFQIEDLLADVSFSEKNSTFNFLNSTPPVSSYACPVWPVCDDYGSLPGSDQENMAEEESHSEEDGTGIELVKKRKKAANFDKPPEPYADMIAKAIMSSEFTSKVEMSKWKSAIRHNLSSHSFFVKTLHKNSQGHFWSIETNFLSIIKEKGTTIGIKKCFSKKSAVPKPRLSKPKKTPEQFFIDQDLYNFNMYNDSAFFSSTENDNSQHSFASSGSSGYHNYKFLSPAHYSYMPQASYIMDNANINSVHFSNQLTY